MKKKFLAQGHYDSLSSSSAVGIVVVPFVITPISRHFLAFSQLMCKHNVTVYIFDEDVHIYEEGGLVVKARMFILCD